MAERSGIEAEVRDRAQRDADYRSQLLADASATLAAEHGIVVPDTLTIRVVEEGPDEVVLVVPARRDEAATELSDAELESSGGGWLTGGRCLVTYTDVNDTCGIQCD